MLYGQRVFTTLSDPVCIRRNPSIFADLVQASDIVFGNEFEFKELGFKSGMTPALCVETLGAKGSRVYRGSDMMDFAPVPVMKLANTNGAGDAFAAGFIAGIFDGLDVPACVVRANMYAGLVLQSEKAFIEK